MKTDIEIAKEAKMQHISQIARGLGIHEDDFEPYGKYKGKVSLKYELKEAKTYNVKVEAVDSSNYYVEATTSFAVGTDIFEVEFLSEYGNLVAGESNEVYVFTSNPDGTPIKTYITVSSDNYTKQVITDENGIGKFVVDVDAIQTNNYKNGKYTKTFKITAVNMNDEEVKKDITLPVETNNIIN